LHESGYAPQYQENQIEKVGVEQFVQVITDDVADECGRGEKESQRGILGHGGHG
jgi:hypothetical protein